MANILKYTVLEKIGEGSYGSVFKARDNITGEMLALKRIPINDKRNGVPTSAMREVSILKYLDHPNIIKLLVLQSKISLQ